MSRYRFEPRPASVTFAALVALLLAGCGGGGGGGDNNDTPMCTNLSFDRAMVTPVAGDIYMDQAASTCTSLDVVILVSNLSSIYTVGFDLTYPTNALQYQSYSVGPLMLKGNPTNPPVVIVSPTAAGVQVAISRFGTDSPVTATGSEALISLHFVRTGSNAGVFDFNTTSGNVSESVSDGSGNLLSASFAPNHGGMVLVP